MDIAQAAVMDPSIMAALMHALTMAVGIWAVQWGILYKIISTSMKLFFFSCTFKKKLSLPSVVKKN